MRVFAVSLFAGIDVWRVPAAWAQKTWREVIRGIRSGKHKELEASVQLLDGEIAELDEGVTRARARSRDLRARLVETPGASQPGEVDRSRAETKPRKIEVGAAKAPEAVPLGV